MGRLTKDAWSMSNAGESCGNARMDFLRQCNSILNADKIEKCSDQQIERACRFCLLKTLKDSKEDLNAKLSKSLSKRNKSKFKLNREKRLKQLIESCEVLKCQICGKNSNFKNREVVAETPASTPKSKSNSKFVTPKTSGKKTAQKSSAKKIAKEMQKILDSDTSSPFGSFLI